MSPISHLPSLPLLAGVYLQSSIPIDNYGSLTLCNSGQVRVTAPLRQTDALATTDLCSTGAIRVLPSAPASTAVEINGGSLKGGGTVDGLFKAGCAVTFEGDVGEELTVLGDNSSAPLLQT